MDELVRSSRRLGLGKAFMLPHAFLMLACVAAPIVYPSTFEWWTATGGGAFFGLALLLDWALMRRAQAVATPGAPTDTSSRPQLPDGFAFWFVVLALVSGGTLLYLFGMRMGLWQPI